MFAIEFKNKLCFKKFHMIGFLIKKQIDPFFGLKNKTNEELPAFIRRKNSVASV